MTGRKLRVLTVEDDEDLQIYYGNLLTRSGCEHRQALTAAQAIMIASGWLPDVVIIDLGLPDMDGQELLERLKQRGEFAKVPIIAVSGYPKWRFQGPKLTTFDDYLVKPITGTQLGQLVAQEAEKRRVLGRPVAV